MSQIFKYRLGPGLNKVEAPWATQWLGVSVDPFGEPVAYGIVPSRDSNTGTHEFYVAMTGEVLPGYLQKNQFMGTLKVTPSGDYMVHVFHVQGDTI